MLRGGDAGELERANPFETVERANARRGMAMTDNVVELPDNLIGKEDEAKLESFGAHLIANGLATRWHWNRERGVDVGFEIYRGGRNETLFACIRRDRARDVFYVTDRAGTPADEGKLDHIMAFVDELARVAHDDIPA